MALHGGFIPFSATFLIFTDYMRPAIRLAALMELRSIYVFTHDSIGVGEDGPTHQPVEQVASLRAIPKLTVSGRPTPTRRRARGAWRCTQPRPGRAAADAPGRARCSPGTRRRRVRRLRAGRPDGKPDVILIATGSEVSLAVEARDALAGRGVKARVVSLPSWELFEAQPQAYRDAVLPPRSSRAWRSRRACRSAGPYVGADGAVVGVAPLRRVGAGQGGDGEYGFTAQNVAEQRRAR